MRVERSYACVREISLIQSGVLTQHLEETRRKLDVAI